MKALLLYHGDSLAHTIRPLVIARSLRELGHEAVLAGEGCHTPRVEMAQFEPIPLPCISQQHVDAHVAAGDYDFYDEAAVASLVASEQSVIDEVKPDVVVADFRPTAAVSAGLQGCDVALLTSGYNQPGYPFPIQLPAWVNGHPQAIASYARKRATQMKRHRLRYLVTEVPDIHPPTGAPGYGHVGPLIEMSDEDDDATTRLVEDGGDNRPLAFVYLGSSGYLRDRLRPIAEGLARGGWRVLAVTGSQTARQEWAEGVVAVGSADMAAALRHAAVCICVGGSGTVYHAIAAATPVVGAAEHLDQDYHLNRVRDLGLGIKLTRAEMGLPSTLAAAAAHVVEDDGIARRLMELAPIVRRWAGGQRAARAICEIVAADAPESPGLWVTEDRLVEHLVRVTPPAITRRRLRQRLRAGARKGMPCAGPWGQQRYCRIQTVNWLMDNDSDLFEAEQRSGRHRRGLALGDGTHGSVTVQVEYDITFEGLDLARGEVRAFLPYPRACRHQRLKGPPICRHDGMVDHASKRAGMIYAWPVPEVSVRKGRARLGYQVVVRRDEVAAAGDGETLAGGRWLDGRERLLDSPRVAAAVRRFGSHGSFTARARRVYEHLMDHQRYERTLDTCQCISCATHAVLDRPGAHCVLLAHAFVGLCRALGVPARPRCGALFGHEERPGRHVIGTAEEPLFGHTWAEFWSGGGGWVPVEFHAIAFAPQAITDRNIIDPHLRQQLTDDWVRMRAYYFGHVDCYRIECSQSVKTIPRLLQRQITQDGRMEWRPPDGLSYRTRLTVDVLEMERR